MTVTPATGRRLGLPLGVVAAAAAFALAKAAGLAEPACWTAAVTALCALWWITEALPIPATSLVPFALFPLTGVLDHEMVANAYGHYMILLLLGGFMISKAIEKSGAHRRMALWMVRLCGRLGRRGLVLGFMVASALSSMWISNTATVLMLLPVALAVLAADDAADLRVPLLLGIAYAGSIGGIGTPIGTPPNQQCMSVYQLETGVALGFPQWMAWGVPIVLLLVPVAWLTLTRSVRRGAVTALPHPGPWRRAETRVLVVFALTALGWIFRANPAGGWSALCAHPDWIGDDTVALAAVAILFLVPDGTAAGGRLLDWETASKLPWGLLLLFGGGLAIATAFRESGLSAALAAELHGLAAMPPFLMVLAICLGVTFLTEITSNTATTALLMPILASAGSAAEVDPKLLMVPAAVSASCAFMLPVATAPNAIVFGTGEVPIRRMVREGVLLNLIGAVIVTAVCVAVLG